MMTEYDHSTSLALYDSPSLQIEKMFKSIHTSMSAIKCKEENRLRCLQNVLRLIDHLSINNGIMTPTLTAKLNWAIEDVMNTLIFLLNSKR